MEKNTKTSKKSPKLPKLTSEGIAGRSGLKMDFEGQVWKEKGPVLHVDGYTEGMTFLTLT